MPRVLAAQTSGFRCVSTAMGARKSSKMARVMNCAASDAPSVTKTAWSNVKFVAEIKNLTSNVPFFSVLGFHAS